jgi:N-acetylglutamate synthase-like GNAT family acetyltransferase
MERPSLLPLDERPDLAETCAAWCYSEWGCHSGGSLASYVQSFEAIAVGKPESHDKTWIGLIHDKIAGMISILKDDHPDFKELSPWLASFFIHPAFRGKGLAEAFITHAVTEAAKLNLKTLYLYTPHNESLYQKHGWETFDYARDPAGLSNQVALMRKTL